MSARQRSLTAVERLMPLMFGVLVFINVTGCRCVGTGFSPSDRQILLSPIFRTEVSYEAWSKEGIYMFRVGNMSKWVRRRGDSLLVGLTFIGTTRDGETVFLKGPDGKVLKLKRGQTLVFTGALLVDSDAGSCIIDETKEIEAPRSATPKADED